MKEKPHLTVRMKIVDGYATVIIVYQSHRCQEFKANVRNRDGFLATNGVTLLSYGGPQAVPSMLGDKPVFYLRGSVRGCDLAEVQFNLRDWELVREAIEEYNAWGEDIWQNSISKF